MKPLELVVCDNYLQGEEIFVESAIEVAMEDIDWEYNVSFIPEEELLTADIPENAVVYVHGEKTCGYITASYMVKLAKERPDLKFILNVDMDFKEEHFKENPPDYRVVKDAYLAGDHASNQIIVTTERLYNFMGGKSSDFKDYITHLRAIRSSKENKLKIMVCKDMPERRHGRDPFTLSIKYKVLEKGGFDYEFVYLSESDLKDETNFPHGALVYVHGNYNQSYSNLTHMCELAEKRPDLKFLVKIDPHFRKENFGGIDENYRLAKEITQLHLEHWQQYIDASQQINESHEYLASRKDETRYREIYKDFFIQLFNLMEAKDGKA